MQDTTLTQGEHDKTVRNALIMAAAEASVSTLCLSRIFQISERQVFTILAEAKQENACEK